MKRQQTDAVTFEIDRNQTAVIQLFFMVSQYIQNCVSHNFRDRAVDSELDYTWKVCAT